MAMIHWIKGRSALRALCAVGIIWLIVHIYSHSKAATPRLPYIPGTLPHSGPDPAKGSGHPIDDLIRDARARFATALDKRSNTLEEAARKYRDRRGRHPPPGFDTWYKVAKKKNAIVVEEFFDRIYHDTNPLWALDPLQMRKAVRNQPFMVRVRNGKAFPEVESHDVPYRVEQWLKLVKEMMPHIPDLDMFVNVMDEPRTLVPFDTMKKYVAEEQKKRRLIPVEEAITKYSGLGEAKDWKEWHDPHWVTDEISKYWDHYEVTCPPGTPGHGKKALEKFNGPVEFPTEPIAAYTYKGYIQNWTAAHDPCLQPHLRGMHGTFIDSISMQSTTELLPMFGECKLPGNSEMLIPGAVYLDNWKKYSGGGVQGGGWASKKDVFVWRGSASGARNKPDNWWHLHRNRFVQMLNASTVQAVESGLEDFGRSFKLDASRKYGTPALKQGKLGEWLSRVADVGFTDMLCHPFEYWHHWWYGTQQKLTCSWDQQFLSLAEPVPMGKFYNYKYIPDMDGMSFSGRWRAFLFSTSMPLKSTIYAEWHDDRLFPWVHFVPFDNTYMDIYGIMDYFVGDGMGHGGRDEVAERIALEGKMWAEMVLRREDMMLYVWRLLLEYARVTDDQRDRLAFVGDLKK